MIILQITTTSLVHFFSKGWENVLFELNVVFCIVQLTDLEGNTPTEAEIRSRRLEPKR